MVATMSGAAVADVANAIRYSTVRPPIGGQLWIARGGATRRRLNARTIGWTNFGSDVTTRFPGDRVGNTWITVTVTVRSRAPTSSSAGRGAVHPTKASARTNA